MKPNTIIINKARGAITEPHVLVAALKQDHITGAEIDVLDQEPPTIDHPFLQKNTPNHIVTPHNAWGSQENRQRLINALAKNLQAWLNNTPVNIVA